MAIEGKGIDDNSFNPRDPREADTVLRVGEAMKDIRKRTEKLALPVIQKLTSGQIDREEAFSQLEQILLDNFSSTTPITIEGRKFNISLKEEFLGNLGLLFIKNGISLEDASFFLKMGSDPEDTRDKVEEVVDPETFD